MISQALEDLVMSFLNGHPTSAAKRFYLLQLCPLFVELTSSHDDHLVANYQKIGTDLGFRMCQGTGVMTWAFGMGTWNDHLA